MNDFDILSSDIRLYEIFGDTSNVSVMQLWVVQIEEDSLSEFRYIYGRVLPSTYSSDRWISKAKDKTKLDEKCSIQMHVLTVSSTAENLQKFFQKFIYGSSLHEASLISGLLLDSKLADGIGTVNFGMQPPIVRPVMHLPTRDYFQCKTKRLSPTSYASVDSGAVSSAQKQSIFTLSKGHDHIFARAVCRTLDTDTGIEFSKLDAWRLGDLEFICAPGLTASEKSKFRIELKGEQSLIELSEPLTRAPADLLMVLTSYNDDCIQASYLMQFDKGVVYPISHVFSIGLFRNQIATAFTLEIYALGSAGEDTRLCLQTGRHFIRGANLNINVMAGVQSSNRMIWLEKQVPNRDKHKLVGAMHVERSTHSMQSEIGGHTDDAWVKYNRRTENKVYNLLPKPSEGRFFPTLSESRGTSRLEMVGWLTLIFKKHPDAQIAWIDPFMEDVGIDLMHQMGSNAGNYLIITTEKKSNEDESIPSQKTRIDRLLAQCTGWGNGHFGNIQLKVLSVPEGKLHDRMILIQNSDGSPIAGYHLSNSIQRASENFPLLVTPIPPDILTDVFKYVDNIIQSTFHNTAEQAPSARLIFDSKKSSTRNNIQEEEGKFFESPRAGDVLAWWLEEKDLVGLSSNLLINLIEKKGYMVKSFFTHEIFSKIPNKFWHGDIPLQDFHTFWDSFSVILANSSSGAFFRQDHGSLPESLNDMLLIHLSPSRSNAIPAKIKTSQILVENYRALELKELLLSNQNPSDIFKYSPCITSYSDYFAIKFLWSQSPENFISWLDEIFSKPIKEHSRTAALSIEASKIICHAMEITKDEKKVNALLKSKTPIVKLFGIQYISQKLDQENAFLYTISKINLIQDLHTRRVVFLWLIKESIKVKSPFSSNLISELIKEINSPLSDMEIKEILQNLQQKLVSSYNTKPWVLEHVFIALIKLKKISMKQISLLWLAELKEQWESGLTSKYIPFSQVGAGAFTDEMAMLFTHLDSDEQNNIISEITKISNQLARTIRIPLSRQVNFSEYIRAHDINLWIYSLSLRIKSLTPNNQIKSLEETLDQSQSLTDRLSAEDVNSLNQAILSYLNSDPNQIENHRISYALESAIKSD